MARTLVRIYRKTKLGWQQVNTINHEGDPARYWANGKPYVTSHGILKAEWEEVETQAAQGE